MTISGMGSGPSFPDETAKIQRQSSVTPEAAGSKGALLSKDTYDVPLEVLLTTDIGGAEAGRPSLNPLFRMRLGDESEGKDPSHALYLELRNKLPPSLKEKLARDEALDFEDRDPNLITLDKSLRVDAGLLAAAQLISIQAKNDETVQESTQSFVALPHRIQEKLLAYEAKAIKILDRYVGTNKSDDPNRDIITRTLTNMKEAFEHLKSEIERGVGKVHGPNKNQPK